MLQTIASLNLSKIVIKKLNEQGYNYVNDLVENLDNVDLSSDIKSDILSCIGKCEIQSALDIEKEELSILKITTFCKELDDILDGGISLQSITELSGSPSAGKTQLALQLCVNVQIPIEFGGLESEAVFICTNSGFSMSRYHEIASACVEHCAEIANNSTDKLLKQSMDSFTVYSVLSRLYYMETLDYVELVAIVESLKTFLQDKKVKLIVIDSISFLFRQGLPMLSRTRILHTMLADLQELASKHDLAVVLTNEITTRPHSGYDGLVPALGESFAHMIPTRLLLGSGANDERIVLIDKSSHLAKTYAPFQITRKGIRDIE